MHVEDLAAHMRPAGRLRQRAARSGHLVEPVEAGIAIGHQHAGEARQMRERALAPAVGRSEEHGRRRTGATVGALVAHVGPEPAGPGLAAARRQHRDRRVVAVQDGRAGDHLLPQEIDQRPQGGRGGAEPTRERRGGQVHPVTGIDLGLTVERQVIVELRYRDVGEQSGSGPPAGNGVVGRGRLHHLLAGTAGEGLAHVAHDLEATRHIVEALGDVLADPA
jgi:hypothetical protein